MVYDEFLWVFFTAFLLAFALTWQIRRLALKRGVMDIPNARSSHDVPTPRGGGLSFVIVTLGYTALALVTGWLPAPLASAALLGGGIVAGIGVVDDLYDLGTRIRLAAHMLAALTVVVLLGPLREIPVFATVLPLGIAAWPFTVLMIIWLINLTNFMDGINGIASVHALGFCGVAALTGATTNIPLALILGGAVLGFVLWNFPSGRIFMGDAGSGFLGILAAVLMLGATGWQVGTGAAVLIVLAPFITDATLTLALRLARGDRVFEAHRIHLYQRLSRIIGGHTPVTLGFAALLAGVMGPLALWAAASGTPGTPLWIAYMICIVGWLVSLFPTLAADPV
jgi:Fuc2NAc and GlcNAc transferase